MVKSHREKAMSLEKKAFVTSRASKYSKTKKQNYLEEASKLYEVAGDEWIKQAKDTNPRDMKHSLSYAVHNYKLATKIAETEEEKERIQRKKDSVESKMNSLMPVKGLQKRLTFAILSIASLVAALFFSTFSLTGYVTNDLTQSIFKGVSLGLFILGLVFAFFYFRKKK